MQLFYHQLNFKLVVHIKSVLNISREHTAPSDKQHSALNLCAQCNFNDAPLLPKHHLTFKLH